MVPSALLLVVTLILEPVFSQIRYALTPIWMMVKMIWTSQKGIRTRLCQGCPLPRVMYRSAAISSSCGEVKVDREDEWT